MFVYANVLQPLIDIADSILRFLHDDVGLGWGPSIIGLTVIVRIAILPLTYKQVKSMNSLRALQPQMKEIQEKYKSDRQRMQQEMMSFYRENKVNPFSSCLPLLLQFPVFMSLFFLLRGQEFKDLLHASGDPGFLFINDLAEPATGGVLIVLMVLFIGSQMASMLVMSVTADKTQQRIFLLLPLLFAAFVPQFPAGLIVYWITTNFWTLGQQLVIRRVSPPPPVVVTAGSGKKSARSERGAKEARTAPGGSPTPVLADGDPKKPPPPPRKRKRRRR
jgi:YidC/Oxa1 family membrane protein insertase